MEHPKAQVRSGARHGGRLNTGVRIFVLLAIVSFGFYSFVQWALGN